MTNPETITQDDQVTLDSLANERSAMTARMILREYEPSALSDLEKMAANSIIRDALNEVGTYFVHD
jgi:hypothetical protein